MVPLKWLIDTIPHAPLIHHTIYNSLEHTLMPDWKVNGEVSSFQGLFGT